MKNFDNYLIRRGLDNSGSTPSGSDCCLIIFSNDGKTEVAVGSATQIYHNKENLGLELKTVYESRSGANWAEKIMKQPDKVNIFKVNSYRTDFNGPKGLQFVETAYGDDNLQIYLPYNYTKDVIDESFPAFIMNKNLRRVVIGYPSKIKNTLDNCQEYFAEEKEIENETNITKIKIGNRRCDFTIIDDRNYNDRSKWGSFEFPTKDLKMLIRLLIRAGWIETDRIKDTSRHIFTMSELGLERSDNNMYGFEIINKTIQRFTKYSDDLWVQIPVGHGGLQFIKTKEPVIYYDKIYGNGELTATVIVKQNSPDKGVRFIGFNFEEEYVFQTVMYGIAAVLTGHTPQYEIDSVWSEEYEEDEDDAK